MLERVEAPAQRVVVLLGDLAHALQRLLQIRAHPLRSFDRGVDVVALGARDRRGDKPHRREVEAGRQDDAPHRLGLAGHVPATAESAPHDLAEVRAAGEDHELERGGLARILGHIPQVVVEQRQRVAVVLERHTQRAANVLDRLIGVFAYACRDVFHPDKPSSYSTMVN